MGAASSNIGRVHYIRKQYDDAILHCLDALKSRKASVGEKHIEVYSTMYNLGLLKQQQQRFEETMEIYQIILDNVSIKESEHDIPNKCLVTVIINVLSIYCKQVMWQKKGLDFMQALSRLQSLRENFGYEDHNIPEALHSMSNILIGFSLHQFALPLLLEKLQIQPEQTIPALGQGVEKATKEFIQTCYNDFKKELDGYMYMKLDEMAKFRGKNKKLCL